MSRGLRFTPEQYAKATQRPYSTRECQIATSVSLEPAKRASGDPGPESGQMRFNFSGRQRKSTLTADEYRRLQRERDLTRACLDYLAGDRRVAFATRTTFVGSGWFVPYREQPAPPGGVWVRVGYAGQPDICGLLKDGRLLAPELKRPGLRLRPLQDAVAARIKGYHGVAGRIDSVPELQRLIDEACGAAVVEAWLAHLAHLSPQAFARVARRVLR